MGLVNTGIKVPHVYDEIYCCIFSVVGLYVCWRSWTFCLDTWHHGFHQIPTDKKNQQVTDSVRNRIMGHVWICQQYNNPNTNLKNNTKMGHWIIEENVELLNWQMRFQKVLNKRVPLIVANVY